MSRSGGVATGTSSSRSPFYGWVVVAGLGVTELVSWGVLVYAFSAFVVPMGAELGWSPGALNAAYALGVATSGLVAVPVGRWLSTHGTRWLMTGGSMLSALALLAWSQTSSLPVFFAVCVLAGLAMAATLYEPAFVLTTGWFTNRPEERARARQRARAVLIVTVCGGLASTVFVPLSGSMITGIGWREAMLVLAAVTAAVGVPIHALLLRDPPRPPSALQQLPRNTASPTSAGAAMRQPSFRWLAVSLSAATAAKNGLSVVLVAYLVARGYTLAHAATIAGAVGVAQVGGRLLVTALRARLPEHRTHATIFLAQALICLLPLTTSGAGPAATTTLWVFVMVYGFGFGLPELLRGTLVVDFYGEIAYPRVNGALSTPVVLARAAGPLLTGLLVTATGTYLLVLLGAGALSLLSAVALLAAHRAHRAHNHQPTGRPACTSPSSAAATPSAPAPGSRPASPSPTSPPQRRTP